jgi:hypothetical protein
MHLEFKNLIGKTFASVENNDNEEIIFAVNEYEKYKLYHAQSCCERVRVESIDGDLEDLVGSEILQAEEVNNIEDESKESYESFTWTYYKLATLKGYVTIRWLGESNGYYSESVDFERVE